MITILGSQYVLFLKLKFFIDYFTNYLPSLPKKSSYC